MTVPPYEIVFYDEQIDVVLIPPAGTGRGLKRKLLRGSLMGHKLVAYVSSVVT